MIKNMINTRQPGELRAFQTRMVTVGRIRLGIYATPDGKKPRPEKLDRFRFTSPDELLIRAVAEEYGGTVRPWSPANDAKRQEWEVISDAAELHVYIVNGQHIDPTYEAWAAGRTCIRRCDGEWNSQGAGEPCVCNGLGGKPRPALKDLCKPTTRVQVMLQRVQGIGSWMLESHGENAAAEMGLLAGFVATAPVPVPAMLRLEFEVRREWNPAPFKGEPRFETREFYVPRFHISAVNAQQIAIGGDALTQTLMAAGAPAALSGDTRMAIEGVPVSAVPAPTPPAAPMDPEELRRRILADIEACTTREALEGIRAKLVERGIDDQAVKDAWNSRMAGVKAGLRIERMPTVTAEALADAAGTLGYPGPEALLAAARRTLRPEKIVELEKIIEAAAQVEQGVEQEIEQEMARARQQLIDRAMEGGREFFNHELSLYDTAVGRGATHAAIVEAGGPAHWLAGDDQGQHEQERALDPNQLDLYAEVREHLEPLPSEAEMQAAGGDCCGGFRSPDDMWSPCTPCPIMQAREAAVEGTVEGAADPLPMIPDGETFDADELYASLMTGASKQAPPLTTAEVNALICATFGLTNAGQATGLQLARLRAGLKAGTVGWRP